MELWIGKEIGSKRIITTQEPLKWLETPKFKILGIDYDLEVPDVTILQLREKIEINQKLAKHVVLA